MPWIQDMPWVEWPLKAACSSTTFGWPFHLLEYIVTFPESEASLHISEVTNQLS